MCVSIGPRYVRSEVKLVTHCFLLLRVPCYSGSDRRIMDRWMLIKLSLLD